MTEKHKCCARVANSGGWSFSQCSRNGSYLIGEKHYCKTHNPEFILEKEKTRDKEWREKWSAQRKLIVLANAAPALLLALKAIVKTCDENLLLDGSFELKDAREAIKQAESET